MNVLRLKLSGWDRDRTRTWGADSTCPGPIQRTYPGGKPLVWAAAGPTVALQAFVVSFLITP